MAMITISTAGIIKTAKVVGAVCTLGGAAASGYLWTVSKLTTYAEKKTEEILFHVSKLIDQKFDQFINASEVVEFLYHNTSFGDARPGEFAAVKLTLSKKRDCGRPIILWYIVNGNGATHTVDPKNVSITDSIGMGINLPVSPTAQTINYTVKVPKTVIPGHGSAYATVDYTKNCPDAPLQKLGPLEFTIL